MVEIKLERKPGVINEIIYDHTVYHYGRYRYYLSIYGLKFIAQIIAEAHATTKYIRFTPFFIDGKYGRQVEFDEDYMFYMECRDHFTEEDEKAHWEKCILNDQDRVLFADIDQVILLKRLEDRREKAIQQARILTPLCRFDDPDTFTAKIFDYLDLLNEIVPEMKQELLEIHGFLEEDLFFGEFCFEIHSG